MKSLQLSLIFIVICLNSHAQHWDRDEKKVIKIVDTEVVRIEKRDKNVVFQIPDGAQIDTSTTLVGDTTGIAASGEYLDYRSRYYPSNSQYSNFAAQNYVTVREYEEFIQYVRDSIAREELFMKHYDEDEAAKYLVYNELYFDEEELEYRYTNLSDRKKCREVFPLDHNMDVDWDFGDVEPSILNHYYLTPRERFYNLRQLDDRKFYYSYYTIDYRAAAAKVTHPFKNDSLKKGQSGAIRGHTDRARFIIDHNIPMYIDDWKWGVNAQHNFDEYAVLSQVYRKTEKHRPMVGMTAVQAQAFCHWKEEQINQRWYDKSELFSANVSLPIMRELTSEMQSSGWTIEEHDYTDQWTITREEYNEFYTYCRDSLMREYFYDHLSKNEEASQLLNYEDYFFDEGSLEYVNFEPSDRAYNRERFLLNMNRSVSIKKSEGKKLKSEFDEITKGRPIYFKYYYIDVLRKSQLGKIQKQYVDSVSGEMYLSVPYTCEVEELDISWDCLGKDLILDRINKKGESSGVRAHKNNQQFIVEEIIAIEPLKEKVSKQNKEDNIIRQISYHQALAYYNWKYPIYKATATDAWYLYVFPSASEFTEMCNGTRMIKPRRELIPPTPAFRYVVHID